MSLNLLLTDGRTVAATAVGNSLFTRTGSRPDGPWSIVASEPLDEEQGWEEVPDRIMVEGTARGLNLQKLPRRTSTRSDS